MKRFWGAEISKPDRGYIVPIFSGTDFPSQTISQNGKEFNVSSIHRIKRHRRINKHVQFIFCFLQLLFLLKHTPYETRFRNNYIC